MAPEQIQGNPLPASDQYALAVMVYEWLCGQPPFDGSALGICAHHVSTAPPRLREHIPSISPAVERVVLKALEKDPHKRYAHVLEFASALKQDVSELRTRESTKRVWITDFMTGWSTPHRSKASKRFSY